MNWQQPFEAPDLGEISRKPFCLFLLSHQLSYLRVALAAHVHMISVYNLASGVPVLPEHEAAIRAGLHQLTGERYGAFIYTARPREKHGL